MIVICVLNGEMGALELGRRQFCLYQHKLKKAANLPIDVQINSKAMPHSHCFGTA